MNPQILSNIIAYILKQEDAPCSASTHLNTAIYLLSKETPEWVTFNHTAKEIIEEAIEELYLLGKN